MKCFLCDFMGYEVCKPFIKKYTFFCNNRNLHNRMKSQRKQLIV